MKLNLESYIFGIVIFLQLVAITYIYSGSGLIEQTYLGDTVTDLQVDDLPDKSFNCEVQEDLENDYLNASINEWAGGTFTTFPRNKTSVFNPEGGDSWKINTNKQGLRDEDISIEKPSETFRILVIGDSYTFGWGLNRSQRYTEVLEQRLNNSYDANIQVVNMGRTDAGMRDYYLTLKDKGIEYDPDLVVVSFYRADRNSHQNSKIALEEVMDENNIEDRQDVYEKDYLKAEYESKKHRLLEQGQIWESTDLEKYGNGVLDLSREEGFDTMLFLFQHQELSTDGDFVRSAKKWAKDCEAELLLPPREFYLKDFEEHTLPQDRHFNQEYNRYMADKLYSEITENNFLGS